MTPEVRSRIFQPLFTTKKSGTGLGLAIDQRIAHDHGATIAVASDVGGGTSFHIDFPVDPPALGLALVS